LLGAVELKEKAVSMPKSLSQIDPSTLDTIALAPITYWASKSF
jgi:hypothetical protein